MPAINKGNTTFCCSSTAFQNIEEVFSFLTSMFESPESIGRINPHTLRPEASQNAQPLFTKLHATKQKHKDLPLIKLLRRYALQDMEIFALLYLLYAAVSQREHPTLKAVLATLNKFGIGSAVANFRYFTDQSSKLYSIKLIELEGRELTISKKFLNELLERREAAETTNTKIRIPTSPRQLYDKLGAYVIGQDEARRVLAMAVFEHFIKINMRQCSGKKYIRNNVLLYGPTGCGKTYLCECLGEILNIPVFIFDSTQYSETGYSGSDVATIITAIIRRTRTKSNVLPPCVVVLDEIDKLATANTGLGHTSTRDVSGKCVQEELLGLVGASFYNVEIRGLGLRDSRHMDIRNILFIATGAFTGIDRVVEDRINAKAIGFSQQAPISASKPQQATAEDFITFGMIPELLGRFSLTSAVEPLTRHQLLDILTKTKGNAMSQYAEVFQYCGVKLRRDDINPEQLADEAIMRGSGARGLPGALARKASELLFENAASPKRIMSFPDK